MGKSINFFKDKLKRALEEDSALSNALANYKALAEKLDRLITQRERYNQRHDEAQAGLKNAEARRRELLESGEDPSSAEADILAFRSQVDSLEPWQEELDHRLIPRAEREAKEAGMAVSDAAKRALEALREIVQEPLAMHLDEIQKTLEDWRTAQKEALAELGLAEGAIDVSLPSGRPVLDQNAPLRVMRF